VGISVLIASTLRNSVTAPASISLTRTLGEPATCEVTTTDATGSVVPAVGNIVEIQDQASDVQFFGTAQEVTTTRRDHTAANECRITATDLNHATTRRLAGLYEWTGKTVLYIVSDIVSNSLTGDLTDVSLVETGPTLDRFAVDYSTVKEAFDALAEIAGMRWYVDELNRLHFFTPSASPDAPFAITDGTNVTSISVRATREDYCNTVTARVGQSLRDPEMQAFAGDGTTKSFSVDYPIAQAPTVRVASVDATVGVLGVDTGKDWYWQAGSAEIRQDDGDTALALAVALEVTYVGIDLIYVGVSDTGEISARATAEGSSGIYHKLIEIEGQLTRSDATTAAQAYLDAHKELTWVLNAETNDFKEPDILTVRPGDVLSFTRAGYGTTGNFLVRSVNLTHMEGAVDTADYQWRGRIEAVKGPILRTYTDILRGTGGSGSISGNGAAVTRSSGAGVYLHEIGTLAANTTVTPTVAATTGATMYVFGTTGASPYTISFHADWFATVPNSLIPAAAGITFCFPFVSRGDGLWWFSGPSTNNQA